MQSLQPVLRLDMAFSQAPPTPTPRMVLSASGYTLMSPNKKSHSFDAFFHMVKNIWHETELMGGANSICALAWKSAADHAENLWSRKIRENQFQAALLRQDLSKPRGRTVRYPHSNMGKGTQQQETPT